MDENRVEYYLFKLKFITPVFFGGEKDFMTCHSDTLFSAICHEMLALYGEDGLKEFVDIVNEDWLTISGLMPFCDEELYIPKPVIYYDRKNNIETIQQQSIIKKKAKRLKFIPITRIKQYIEFVKSGGQLPFEEYKFGVDEIYQRVAISGFDKPQPYTVGGFTFNESAGLYFILGLVDTEYIQRFKIMLKSLVYSGLGGKRNIGFGKFKPSEKAIQLSDNNNKNASVRILNELLHTNANYYMSLSLVSPSEQEIDNLNIRESFYTLVQRRGFIQSTTYGEMPQKRKPCTMFGAGSCFKDKLKGIVYNVAEAGRHPVYRYGKGMYIGVSI